MCASSKRDIRNYQRILIVEGYSDLLFYAEVLEYLDKNLDQIFIKHFNGRSDLEASLETLLNAGFLSEKSDIAVIVDADIDGNATANRIENTLTKLTKQHVRENQWSPKTTGKPRIGFLVVPSPDSTGEIEDVVWNAWSMDNATATQCVDSFVDCMSRQSPPFTAQSHVKGKLSALMSLLNDEDPRLGPSVRNKRKHFDFAHSQYARLMKFLQDF